MKLKALLFNFFMFYGKEGIRKASWRGAYEAKVPQALIDALNKKHI